MLKDLTPSQLADWMAFNDRHLFTAERDDLRQEAFIHRYLGMRVGADPGELPKASFPYFVSDFDPVEALAAIQRTKDGIVETPNGLKWKEGHGPVDR